MVVKKSRKMRGSRRHGWGKHHRNKGNKGGCGNAGRGKRSDHKKPSYRKVKLGKRGFTSHKITPAHTINFKQIEDRIETWKTKKIAVEKDGFIHVDLGKMGYTKLLGTGKLTMKLRITVPSASKKAIEKINAAGGETK